jgi:hypothetical protein
MTMLEPARRHPAGPRLGWALGLAITALAPFAAAAAADGGALSQPPAPAAAPEPATQQAPEAERPFRLSLGLDSDFRHSSYLAFNTGYPYAASAQETVDPGSHLEVSNVQLRADYQPGPLLAAHLLFNGVNLDYRNPTSTDHPYDLAELWVRYGQETPVATVPSRAGAYVKVGKFDRPEKPLDRPLASYGLLDTAFNLFQDVGVEAGADLGRHFFAKAAFTEGNPLFVRDPGALAGDTPDILAGTPANLASGLVILYDSHVETFDWSHPETAGYLGWRIGDAAGANGVELMAWGRRRTLAAAADLPGSPLDADLAVFLGADGYPILPIHGNGKEEAGINLWAYQQGGGQIFGQWVYQKVAGLARSGFEIEGSQRVDLPLVLAAGGHQTSTYYAPALRYSRLHDAFPNLVPTPEPTLAWDWEKYDGGVRFGLWREIDLTLEYSYNRIFVTSHVVDSENEALATLRLRFDLL